MALPPRTLDTMSEAIAMSSPSGKTSKAAHARASKRLGESLFGPGGLQGPVVQQPTEREYLVRLAKEARDLAARGMGPRTNLKRAKELEAKIAEIDGVSPAAEPLKKKSRGNPFRKKSAAWFKGRGKMLKKIGVP